jgi:hypothetical protein
MALEGDDDLNDLTFGGDIGDDGTPPNTSLSVNDIRSFVGMND